MKIDKEFAELIPPLTEDEYKGLETSLITEGCRDALVVWNGILVDGHNRYKICTEHSLVFRTVQRDFEDRDTAKLWIMNNQLSRRNLNDFQHVEIVHKCENAVKAQAKKRQATSTGGANPQLTMLQDIERLSMLSKLRAKNYDKKAELVAAYGNQWRAHIPKGYSLFNPLDGHFIFNARSLTENVLGAALDNVCDLLKLSNDTKDKLHEKISRPFSTQLMVLPNELTKTLEKLSTPTQRGFFSQAFQKISSGWK